MKNIPKIYIFLFLLSFFTVFSCHREAEKSFQLGDKEIKPISKKDLPLKQYLISQEWGPDYWELGAKIKFNEDQTLSMSINYEGDHHWWASYYTIEGNKIILYLDFSYNKEGTTHQDKKTFTFTLTEAVKNINYSEALVSEDTDTIFWNTTKKKLRSGSAVFDNIPVTLIEKTAYASSITHYYSYPSLDAEQWYFVLLDDNFNHMPESYTINPTTPDGLYQIELLGVAVQDPSWYLVYRPIMDGSYEGMSLKSGHRYINYCWVRADEITFK